MGDLRINRPARFRRMFWQRPADIVAGDIPGTGHNGGPPLDEHIPEWGVGGIGNYFSWRAASEAAFKKVPVETAIRRARKAASLGLTFSYNVTIGIPVYIEIANALREHFPIA